MTSALRDLILKDLWLKLFSLGLAILIYFTVTIALEREVSPSNSFSLAPLDLRTFSNQPVVILSSAEDVRSVRVNPKEVEVTVQGDARILKKLQSKDIRVLLDLTGIAAAHDFRKRVEVSTPAGVTYVKVDPEEVQVIFPPK